MSINLANVNISLQQFQAVSSGKYNAGEVKLSSETSLTKVNNHVGFYRSKNTVALSHEEILAIKQAFVKALSAGGVQRDELNRIRTQLGLAADASAEGGDKQLHERAMKPLSRQQIREILDRNAATINDTLHRNAIRTSEQLQRNVSEQERASRAETRGEVNASLAQSRTVNANSDMALFERLAAGDLDGRTKDERERMLVFARHELDALRAKYGPNPPDNDKVMFTARFAGGQKVSIATGKSAKAAIAMMEDAIFHLTYAPEADNEEDPSPEMTNAAYNAGLAKALSNTNKGAAAPLPGVFREMLDSLVASARALYGADAIPQGTMPGEIVPGSDTYDFINNLGGERKVVVGDVREWFAAKMKEECILTIVQAKLRETEAALGFPRGTIRPDAILKREPAFAAALNAAATPAEVARAFADFAPQIEKFVRVCRAADDCAAKTKSYVAEKFESLGSLPAGQILHMIEPRNLTINGRKIADKIASGAIKAETPEEIEAVFRAEAEKFARPRIEAFAKLDAMNLTAFAKEVVKAHILTLDSLSPNTFDLDKFARIAEALRPALAELETKLSAANLDVQAGFDALVEFKGRMIQQITEHMGAEIMADSADINNVASSVLPMAIGDNLALAEKARAFVLREDARDATRDAYEANYARADSAAMVMRMSPYPEDENKRLARTLGTDAMPPLHAKALVEACREAGMTNVTTAEAVALFAPGKPAANALAEPLAASNAYISPTLLKSLAAGALKAFSNLIADGKPLPELALSEADLVAVRKAKMAQDKQAAIGKFVEGNGPAAQQLKTVLSNKLGAEPVPNAHVGIAGEIERNAAVHQNRGLLVDMKNLAAGKFMDTSFYKDFRRMNIALAGVGVVSKTDANLARDQFAKFISRNPDATYSSLEPAMKKKADIVMQLATQTTLNAVTFGTGTVLDPDGRNQVNGFMPGGSYNTESLFALEFSANGDVVIKGNLTLKPEMVVVAGEPVVCGKGSEVKYFISTSIDAEELDRLSGVDFSAYDDAPLNSRLHPVTGPNNMYAGAIDLVPAPLRMKARREVSFLANLK